MLTSVSIHYQVKQMKTMLDYISEIPAYMAEHMEEGDYLKLREDFLSSGKRSITIIASGSSNNASNCAYYGIKESLGAKLAIHTPHTYVNCEEVDKESFHIVISQSGRSVNTLKVLDKLREAGAVIHFITDNVEMEEDDLMKIYHLDVGNEEVPFVTKGMSSTVFFLLRFAGVVFPESVFEEFRKYQKLAEDHFESNRDFFRTVKRVHIIGTGTCRSVAMEGALKFCETLHIAASGYETEEFLHGGNFELLPDHLLIAIDGNDFDHERVRQLDGNISLLCDHFLKVEGSKLGRDVSVIPYLAYFQTLVYLINRERGNGVPVMEEKYLEFEGRLKAKTINYYQ